MVGSALFTFIVATLVGLTYYLADVQGLTNSTCRPEVDDDCPDSYFATSYWEARTKFRNAAKAANARLVSEVAWKDPTTDLEYTIDAAIVDGTGSAKDNVFVLASGTHGSEGFAGSALQIKLLEDVATRAVKSDNRATIVLLHALNPSGMGKDRRFNHNNVDLNRNWLSDEQWKEVLQRDPDHSGYMTQYDSINPKMQPTFWNIMAYFARTLYKLGTVGQQGLKKALVPGQYHDPTGCYYGGNGKPEINQHIVRKILKPFSSAKRSVLLDIHTGLGPSGIDTLMTGNQSYFEEAKKAFEGVREVECARCGVARSTSTGYESQRGSMNAFSFFENKPLFQLTVEFGTVPMMVVGFGVVFENAAYNTVPDSELHLEAGRRLRNVFYSHTLPWKRSVLSRGMETVRISLNYLSQQHLRTVGRDLSAYE